VQAVICTVVGCWIQTSVKKQEATWARSPGRAWLRKARIPSSSIRLKPQGSIE
jgi:hypothetical protein